MRQQVVASLCFLSLVLASMAARASTIEGGLVDSDIHLYAWRWPEPPSATALRDCVAELEQLARRHADEVTVTVGADRQLIVLHPLSTEIGHFDLAFPGKTAAGQLGGYANADAPEDPVIGAAILILRHHFPAKQLAIGVNPPWLDLAAARALYQESTGREASPTPELVPFMRLVPVPDAYRMPFGFGFGSYGTLGAIVVLVLLGFAFTGGRGSGFGAARLGGGYGSYYLFWLVAPTVLAFASAHPLLLVVVPVGLVARRWLPDPYLWLRRAGRVTSLRTRVHANPNDATSQRQLAMLYLELRRSRAALPLVERALAREPGSAELLYLRGVALLGQRRWQPAVDAFIAVLQIDARFRYGDPYLRMADALVRLGRWQDAEETLEYFVGINGSSLEGWYKLATARGKRDPGGREASAKTRREARQVYAQLPGFQRRQQLFWYLRTFV